MAVVEGRVSHKEGKRAVSLKTQISFDYVCVCVHERFTVVKIHFSDSVLVR